MAGRGFGKTRTGAEWVRWKVETGQCKRLALIGQTTADVRDVMIEGESGLLAVSPPWFKPVYYPSKRKVIWPNGAYALTFSAEEPDQLRGPQHDGGWADEIAKWRYADDTWSNFMFGLRLGANPQCVATGTPSPTKLIRELIEDPQVVISRGSTYENRANLAPRFLQQVIRKYEGTRLGRQELLAELLLDTPGALWRLAEMIEAHRRRNVPEFRRIVVAVDPAVTSGEDSAETGIVVVALGQDDHGYVLEDRSLRGTPTEWATEVIATYHKWQADRVIAETNNGGDLVETTIRMIDDKVSYRGVRAARGKLPRAEPVSALYEQGRVHHVGAFKELEDQMCTWVPGAKSPDHLDALVWGLTELMVDDPTRRGWRGQIRGALEQHRKAQGGEAEAAEETDVEELVEV